MYGRANSAFACWKVTARPSAARPLLSILCSIRVSVLRGDSCRESKVVSNQSRALPKAAGCGCAARTSCAAISIRNQTQNSRSRAGGMTLATLRESMRTGFLFHIGTSQAVCQSQRRNGQPDRGPEEALAGAFPQYGVRFQIAVLARHDPQRGEALVAVSNEQKLNIEEVRAAIRSAGLSNLYVPREVKYLREIPKLGTGKVNHRELQRLIEE